MKITSFNRQNCGDVRRVLEQALQDAGIEGVTISTSTGRFSSNEYGFKVSVQTTATSSDGYAIGSALKQAMQMHNLSKMVAVDGGTLVDYHPRKHRYPFIVEKNGKRWKYSVAQAKGAFS